jgi:DNA-binding IclR family transcriptional regulator
MLEAEAGTKGVQVTDDGRASSYQAPALEKGLEILEALAGVDGMAMSEIAAALGRTHNEIYRMLVVLERRGYIARSADDRYTLTGRIFDLAMRQAPQRNLHDSAMPVMHRVAETLWQSCHLAVRSEGDIVVVARVESPDLLGFAVRVGYRRPMLRSTSGRVIYAHGSAAQRTLLAPLLQAQTQSQAEWRRFERDCEIACKQGYFSGPSAYVSSITDIGAPIFDGEGDIAASLTVPFVSGVAAHTRVEDAVHAVKDAALAISETLRTRKAPS